MLKYLRACMYLSKSTCHHWTIKRVRLWSLQICSYQIFNQKVRIHQPSEYKSGQLFWLHTLRPAVPVASSCSAARLIQTCKLQSITSGAVSILNNKGHDKIKFQTGKQIVSLLVFHGVSNVSSETKRVFAHCWCGSCLQVERMTKVETWPFHFFHTKMDFNFWEFCPSGVEKLQEATVSLHPEFWTLLV